MSKQFEQLEILYKQILIVSNNVKVAIDKQDYDEVLNQENMKSVLVSRVSLAQKTVQLTDEEAIVIDNLKKQILSQDRENIDRMNALKEKTLVELKTLNSQNKIANKYEQQEFSEGTICDYTSD